MSSEEMFNLCGYELELSDEKEILYKMKWEISSTYYVAFKLKDKVFETFMLSDSPFEPSTSFDIDMNLYKAIKKQIEELGW